MTPPAQDCLQWLEGYLHQDLTIAELEGSSNSLWTISPPSRNNLIDMLNSTTKEFPVTLSWSIQRCIPLQLHSKSPPGNAKSSDLIHLTGQCQLDVLFQMKHEYCILISAPLVSNYNNNNNNNNNFYTYIAPFTKPKNSLQQKQVTNKTVDLCREGVPLRKLLYLGTSCFWILSNYLREWLSWIWVWCV